MTVDLIVPWRPEPARERIWNEVANLWVSRHPVRIVEGYASPDGPWCKGEAWADGMRRSSDHLVCLMDADCYVPKLDKAVELVLAGARWAQAQNVVVRFTPSVTEAILQHEISIDEAMRLDDPYEEPPRHASAGVGTILRREDALAIPLDPRFKGWGWEDCAWWCALTTLLGEPAVLPSSFCFHLWHPPQHDRNRRPGAASESWQLYRRYVRATGRPERMRGMLEELVSAAG